METIEELTEYVSEKARQYVGETGDTMESFPVSIVDFVIEYVSMNCHFPNSFTEKKIASVLSKGKNSLAMACVDIYGKARAEGEVSHSENGISRQYDSAWITFDLISNFPNYVEIFV
jgi:hypothetical protein